MAHENATPRPWFRDASFESGGYIRAEDTTLVVSCMHAYGRETVPARSNAALIVEAVNAYDTLRAENERLEKEVRRLRRIATDNAYMRDAYHAMLMPTGLKVAAMWKEQGVQRQRTSWSDNAWLLNGEERAQCILDWDAAPRREVLPGEIDGNLSEAAS